jgi:hypothetical protein
MRAQNDDQSTHELPIVRQAELLDLSRSSVYCGKRCRNPSSH